MVENSDFVDAHMLISYLDEITSLKSELQGLKKDILFLDNFGERVRRVSYIKQLLLQSQVVISRLMEWMKKEPTPQVFGMPLMGGVSLP